MAYNPSFPGDDGQLADFPPAMREQIRALVEDAVVNALKVQGLTPGNNAGDIPISNGTKCTNLNADKLDNKDSTEFAAATHTHAAATGSAAGLMSSADFTKLAGIATGAQVNQNAFSNILANGVTIQADSATDTIEFIAGTNIALTPDATNDRLTIGVTGKVASATAADTATAATSAAACTGNSATATKLATARTIALSGKATGTATNFDGSGNISIPVTAITADSCTGNSATATKLATARTINGVAFDGSGNITVSDSTKAPLVSPALTGTPTAPTATVGTNTTQLATTAFVQAAAMIGFDDAHNFATPGYQKFSNGLILQWGLVTANATVTLPIAFPNACLAAFGSINTQSGGFNSCSVYIISKSQIGVYYYSGSASVYWLAIGY